MSYRSSSDLKAPPGYRIAHYLIEGRPYLGWVHDNYPLCVFWSPRWRHSDEVVQHMIRWSETPGRASSDHWNPDVYCCLADLEQEDFRQRVTEFAA